MVRLTYCLHRKPGMSADEFHRYWREVHGPLVRRHAGALRVRRYVQAHATAARVNDALRSGRGGPEPYDGVAELWFDSVEDFVEGAATPEAQQAIRELQTDEAEFIDMARSPLFLVEEEVFLEP